MKRCLGLGIFKTAILLACLAAPALVAGAEDLATSGARRDFAGDLQRVARLTGEPGAVRAEAGRFILALEGPLTFTNGQRELDLASRETLRRVAALLLLHPGARAALEGHSDDRGDAERNRLLSLGRAAVVRDELRRLGVPAARLRIEGFGESRPRADNGSASGRALNRRVEIRFTLDAPAR